MNDNKLPILRDDVDKVEFYDPMRPSKTDESFWRATNGYLPSPEKRYSSESDDTHAPSFDDFDI